MRSSVLLIADAVINLALGVLLIVFPAGTVTAMGIPGSGSAFYPNVLGAVLFGIGIALLIERFRGSGGLALYGAVSINLCGGVVLAAWLIWGSLQIPTRGFIILWALVIVLVGISSFEILSRRINKSVN